MTVAATESAAAWRLPEEACALLALLVDQHRPDLIVECGSGQSTVVLANALRTLQHGKLVALEHESEYRDATRTMLYAQDLLDYADVRLAPLEPHGCDDLLAGNWYARDKWDDLDGIGLLVVDGPPGGSARYARGPALPLLRNRMLPGCIVVLDDVNREPERTIWRDWGIDGTRFGHAKGALVYGTLG